MEADIYTKTAAKHFGVKEGDVTPQQRQDAKIMNFGSIYGSSGQELRDKCLPKVYKYYIDYTCDKPIGEEDAYYQLVRSADKAILYANPLLDNVFLQCWRLGIKIEDVVVL